MNTQIIISNARHETGHWITGWLHGQSSTNIVISCSEDDADSYCERLPHPDFDDIEVINQHLRDRVINLIAGAKAERFIGGNFHREMYRSLISNYKGAWPDFFLASELFRYYFRSIPDSIRKLFEDEWLAMEVDCETIIRENNWFLNQVAEKALQKYQVELRSIFLSKNEILEIYCAQQKKTALTHAFMSGCLSHLSGA